MKRKAKEFAPVVIRNATPNKRITEVSGDLQNRINEDVKAGRVYTIREIADLMRVSYEKARQICSKEPGIIRFGDIRVPHSILENIIERLTFVSVA